MAGLYIHIPFCRQKCHYCNFYSLATRKYRQEIFDGLMKELDLQRNYLGGDKLETIYFGGGTPSLYDPELLEKIVQKAISVFGISSNPEITMEANPDDITPQWLTKLAKTSVNRLSIGVQSFHDEDLKYLNRNHSGKGAIEAVKLSQEFGFTNLSVDLIYGIPTLTDKSWLNNLEIISSLKVSHVSAYALTVEPGTALDHFIRKGKVQATKDENAQKHFGVLVDFLTARGFEHYEISNFSLPDKYARHNTSYWLGAKYLGIGPSAHSFDTASRQWNVANIKSYLEGVRSEHLDFEKEELTQIQKVNEYIMTSLRTMWGLDLSKVGTVYGSDWSDEIRKQVEKYEISGQVKIKGQKIYISETGKFFADGIASDLFFDESEGRSER